MFRSTVVLIVFLSLSRLAVAGQPPPTADDPPPVLASPAITVPVGVLGDGKRESPYTFDAATICVLMFPNPALPKFAWDVDDAVPGILLMPGNGAVAFNLEHPGEYFVQCTWEGGKSKAWLVIKGSGPSPPPGPADAKTEVIRKMKSAFIGSDAKKDAATFAAICKGASDSLEATPASTQGAAVAAFKAATAAAKWPGGKYIGIPEIVDFAMPPANEKAVVTAAENAAMVGNLRILSDAAKQIAAVK